MIYLTIGMLKTSLFGRGFIETQIEGEKDEKQEFKALSYEDTLKTGDDVFDDKDQGVDDTF